MTAIYFMSVSLFFFWNAYTGTYGEVSEGKKTIVHTSHGIKHLINKL